MATRPTFLQVMQLQGVNDLPYPVKCHLVKALLAELEGNAALAASELELAVKMEDALREQVISSPKSDELKTAKTISPDEANAALLKFLEIKDV